jgi:hypothetical protein
MMQEEEIAFKALMARLRMVGDFIRLGGELGLLKLDLAAAQEELAVVERAIASHGARRADALGPELREELSEWKEELKSEVDAALTKGGVRSVGAKMERLVAVHREMMALTGHDDEQLAVSAMDPLKREMVDWVVRQVYRRGDQARLIRVVWTWYESQPELKAAHPIRQATLVAEVSRQYRLKLRGKYHPLTRYRCLELKIP